MMRLRTATHPEAIRLRLGLGELGLHGPVSDARPCHRPIRHKVKKREKERDRKMLRTDVVRAFDVLKLKVITLIFTWRKPKFKTAKIARLSTQQSCLRTPNSRIARPSVPPSPHSVRKATGCARSWQHLQTFDLCVGGAQLGLIDGEVGRGGVS